MTAKTKTHATPEVLYFSGALLRKELLRRHMMPQHLSYEIYRRTGHAPGMSTMKDILNAGAYWDDETGKIRLRHQPNATIAYAILLALGLTPDALLARL